MTVSFSVIEASTYMYIPTYLGLFTLWHIRPLQDPSITPCPCSAENIFFLTEGRVVLKIDFDQTFYKIGLTSAILNFPETQSVSIRDVL